MNSLNNTEAGFAGFSPDSEIIKGQVAQETQKQQATTNTATPDLGTLPADLTSGIHINHANNVENVDVADAPVDGFEAVGEFFGGVGEALGGVGEAVGGFFEGVGEILGGL